MVYRGSIKTAFPFHGFIIQPIIVTFTPPPLNKNAPNPPNPNLVSLFFSMIIQDATSSCSEVSIFSSVSSSGVGVGSWSGFCLRSEGEWGDFVSPRVPGTVYYNVVPCRNTNQQTSDFSWEVDQPTQKVTRVTSSVFFCLQKSENPSFFCLPENKRNEPHRTSGGTGVPLTGPPVT